MLPTVALMAGAKAYRNRREYTDYGGLPTNPTPKSDGATFSGVNPKFGVLWEPKPDVQAFIDITRSADVPDFTDLSQTIASTQQFVPLAAQHGWTRRKLLDLFELGGRYPAIVGDASQVADTLASWVDETGVDGFNLSRTVVPESYEDFVDLVVPALQDRGRYKTAYAEGSLRHKLFAEGDRLPQRHAAAAFRDL